MGLYKNNRQQNNYSKKQKRSPVVEDTTAANMMGYSGQGSTNMDSKNYGKVKSKGGITKSKTIKNKY